MSNSPTPAGFDWADYSIGFRWAEGEVTMRLRIMGRAVPYYYGITPGEALDLLEFLRQIEDELQDAATDAANDAADAWGA